MAHRSIQNAVYQKDTADQGGTAVSVTTGSTVVASPNADRAEITITNDHATQIVYLKLAAAAATANSGIRLNAAGGSYTTSAYTGEIRGISVGGTSTVLVVEV